METSEPTILTFSVDSALLEELGEKLVESVHLALSELVKNAYDADATEVIVSFTKSEEGASRIEIIDNGSGMNFDAVSNYWMRIATTNKENRSSKVFGRPLTGAKGIGRFSCRRLGTKLTLITIGTKKGNKVGLAPVVERTKVEFNWIDFKPGLTVSEVECHGQQSRLVNQKTGTILIIDGLVEEWKKSGINWLKRKLAVLTANSGLLRKGYSYDPGFNVLLETEDVKGGIRDIREDLINAGWGTLSAKITKKGFAKCTLDAMGLGVKTITSSKKYDKLHDVSLEIGIMVDVREQMRDVSIISKQSLKKILPDWGGIQIKYRGFRVYPYGDDDWLDIDHDRGLRKGAPKGELSAFANSLNGVDGGRSLLNMLSMKSYIGNVSIGGNAAGFEMKASREGFIDSEEVRQLKDFVRFAVDWSTILRDFYLRQVQARRAERAKEKFEEVIGGKIEKSKAVSVALQYVKNAAKSVSEKLPEDDRQQLELVINEASELIEAENESMLVELTHLRLIASTATLLLIFSHEIKSLLGFLEQTKNAIQLIADKIGGKFGKKLFSIGEDTNDLKERLNELLQLTSLISNTKKKNITQLAFKPKLKKAIKIFELITTKYSIEISIEDVPNNIVLKSILEAELYSILINVLSNSIKAVIAQAGNSKISITSYVLKGKIFIEVCDNGIGLPSTRFDEVFIPFVSDPEGELYFSLNSKLNPEDSVFVGAGSGLGLGIVQAIVKARGGKVQFIEPHSGWSTVLKIQL